MQATLETPHFWQWLLGQLSPGVVGFLGALGAMWLKSKFEKRKDESTIDLTDSQADLNRAQERKSKVDTAAEVMALLDKAVIRSAEMNLKLEAAQREAREAKAVEMKLRKLSAYVVLKEYMNESELKEYLDDAEV